MPACMVIRGGQLKQRLNYIGNHSDNGQLEATLRNAAARLLA
jgi:hypothetical protein